MEKDLIIKAMECCNTNSEIDCRDCPYRNKEIDLYDGCVNTLVKDALALIKQLTEEVADLKAIAEGYQKQFEDCANDRARLTEENERLKQTITQLGKNNDEIARVYPLAIKEAKADTVREMHSKIKDRCIEGGIYPAFVASTIDQIAKEMLEDNQ